MGQQEAGTRVYRSRKEARSGMTERESNGKAYVVGQQEAGTQVYRSGMDSVVRGHWTSYPTDGLWNDKSVCLICV